MASRRECPQCQRLDSVHAERVIKGKVGITEYTCAACHYEWEERDAPEEPLEDDHRL